MATSSVKFLADQNISPKLVRILHQLDERSITSIYHEADMVDGLDAEWLPKAAERGYVCVTCDCRMATELSLAQILISEKVKVIFLSDYFADSKKWEQALWLLRYWQKIKAFAQDMSSGQLVRVHKNGKIVAVVPGRKRHAPPSRAAKSQKPPGTETKAQTILEF